MTTDLLFAYGTIQQMNFPFVQDDTITGRLFDIGSFPGLVPDDRKIVYGKVYKIDASLWPRLDTYEGCPALYRRELVTTRSGLVVNVYIFNQPVSGYKELRSGRWLKNTN